MTGEVIDFPRAGGVQRFDFVCVERVHAERLLLLVESRLNVLGENPPAELIELQHVLAELLRPPGAVTETGSDSPAQS